MRADIVKGIDASGVRAKSMDEGLEVVTSAPDEFMAQLRKQSRLIARIAKAANIQPADH